MILYILTMAVVALRDLKWFVRRSIGMPWVRHLKWLFFQTLGFFSPNVDDFCFFLLYTLSYYAGRTHIFSGNRCR